MPELPEVEILKRYVDSTSLNQKILEVRVRDQRILEGISSSRLVTVLKDNEFTSSLRQR